MNDDGNGDDADNDDDGNGKDDDDDDDDDGKVLLLPVAQNHKRIWSDASVSPALEDQYISLLRLNAV
jgi:hypothetical protein